MSWTLIRDRVNTFLLVSPFPAVLVLGAVLMNGDV